MMKTLLVFIWTISYTYSADDFCSKFSSPEVIDDLLTRTRNQLPETFSLPDKVGLIGIYSANITNLNKFVRSRERQIVCNGNDVVVPVVWFQKPVGRFMAQKRLIKSLRKVYQITVGILEANLQIEFNPIEDQMAVATLKTLTVTRLSDIRIKTVGFGLIGDVISALGTLLIRLFDHLFSIFMENNFKNEIENVMVRVPIWGNFFSVFRHNPSSDSDDRSSLSAEDMTEDRNQPEIAENEHLGMDQPEMGVNKLPINVGEIGVNKVLVDAVDPVRNQGSLNDLDRAETTQFVETANSNMSNRGSEEEDQQSACTEQPEDRNESMDSGSSFQDTDVPVIEDNVVDTDSLFGNRPSEGGTDFDYDPTFPYEKLDPRFGDRSG